MHVFVCAFLPLQVVDALHRREPRRSDGHRFPRAQAHGSRAAALVAALNASAAEVVRELDQPRSTHADDLRKPAVTVLAAIMAWINV